MVRVLVLTIVRVRTIVLGGVGVSVCAGVVVVACLLGTCVTGLFEVDLRAAGVVAVVVVFAVDVLEDLRLWALPLDAVVIRCWPEPSLVTRPPAPVLIDADAWLSDCEVPLVIRGPLCCATLPAPLLVSASWAATPPPEADAPGVAFTDAGGAVVVLAGGGAEPPPPHAATPAATATTARVRGVKLRRDSNVLLMSTIIASDERRVVESVPHQLLIGGEWRDGEHGTLSVEDPATGEVLVDVADASPADAVAALDAAVEAAPEWAAYPPRERGEILRRAFETIIERADDLALLMTLEMGKPLGESRAEIIYAAEFLRWFSEEAVRIDGRYSVSPNGNGRILTMAQPV
ncbi:MAG TPA: aldehyde dehydrogenase family protein, partial [Chloroflexota bacterium]